jgi:ribosomal protein S21
VIDGIDRAVFRDATRIVVDGDLGRALSKLRRITAPIIAEVRKRRQYTAPSEARRRKARKARDRARRLAAALEREQFPVRRARWRA